MKYGAVSSGGRQLRLRFAQRSAASSFARNVSNSTTARSRFSEPPEASSQRRRPSASKNPR